MTKEKGKFLSRAELLKVAEFKIEKIEIDDVGNFVYIREMTGSQRDKYDWSLMRENPNKKSGFEFAGNDHSSKLVVMALCDEKGELIFKPGDWGTLSRSMSAKSLTKLEKAIKELNGIDEEEKERLEKNLEGGQVAN